MAGCGFESRHSLLSFAILTRLALSESGCISGKFVGNLSPTLLGKDCPLHVSNRPDAALFSIARRAPGRRLDSKQFFKVNSGYRFRLERGAEWSANGTRRKAGSCGGDWLSSRAGISALRVGELGNIRCRRFLKGTSWIGVGAGCDPQSGNQRWEDRAISSESLRGKQTIDARGLVVSPGFIDLHEHGQEPKPSV